jgi:tetratricopeptide (TPR) repeat protein
MAAEKNPYAILNLPKSAVEEEIKAAYIELVKRFDPEKHTDRFMEIQRAYKTLTDPGKRAGIDTFTLNPIKGEFTFSDEERSDRPDEELTAEIDASRSKLESAPADATSRVEYFRSLMRRSHVRMSRKMWSEAISDWTTILKVDSTHLRARNNLLFAYMTLGYQYSRHGLADEAMELWERALKMNPGQPQDASQSGDCGRSGFRRRPLAPLLGRGGEALEGDAGGKPGRRIHPAQRY